MTIPSSFSGNPKFTGPENLLLNAESQEILRMQDLISDISAILVNLPHDRSMIKLCVLMRIVEFLGIDRSVFRQFSMKPTAQDYTYAIRRRAVPSNHNKTFRGLAIISSGSCLDSRSIGLTARAVGKENTSRPVESSPPFIHFRSVDRCFPLSALHLFTTIAFGRIDSL
jgi:hypothetical protein